jgi:hypothetical protein
MDDLEQTQKAVTDTLGELREIERQVVETLARKRPAKAAR